MSNNNLITNGALKDNMNTQNTVKKQLCCTCTVIAKPSNDQSNVFSQYIFELKL